MDKVSISMKNCFGIKKLNHTFDFSICNAFTIYAINGTMKSSFARTFKCFQDNKIDEIKDKIYDIQGSFELKFDNNNAIPEQVFVIESFAERYEANISNLLINEDLNRVLQTIYQQRNKLFDKLITKSDFKFESNLLKNEKYQILEDNIKRDLRFDESGFLINLSSIKEEQLEENFENIQYSLIFDETLLNRIKTSEFQSKIKDYLEFTDKVYEDYSFLAKGKLTLPKLKDVSKALKKSTFFESENKIILKNCEEQFSSKEELNRKIEAIENKLKESQEFTAIEKILSTTNGKMLKDMIELNPHIIPWLKKDKLSKFKKVLWLSYLQAEDIKPLLESLIQDYTNFKTDIDNIEIDNTEWSKILEIYKQRFSVPYEMRIANLKNAIIGANLPQVEFLFTDGDNQKSLKRQELDKLNTLSQGEKRALYLLNIIFEVEQIKKENKETLFIIDDIADSFDYKNKYAIIEYLCEIANQPNFKLIILSHNFDFYRAISSRLSVPRKNRLFATKKEDIIELAKEHYQKQPFIYWRNNLTANYILALIPFVRNIIEYSKSLNNKSTHQKNYNFLTDLLHQKENTNNYTFEDCINIFNDYLDLNPQNLEKIKREKIIPYLFKTCNELLSATTEVLLEHKLILAMGIRHRAEYFMIETLKMTISETSLAEKLINCNSNQTRFLFNLYVDASKQFETLNKYQNTLEEVNIITPENIHLNSFMYEPIMDMDIIELRNLYERISKLTKEVDNGTISIGN